MTLQLNNYLMLKYASLLVPFLRVAVKLFYSSPLPKGDVAEATEGFHTPCVNVFFNIQFGKRQMIFWIYKNLKKLLTNPRTRCIIVLSS